jgi:hypothetical protein
MSALQIHPPISFEHVGRSTTRNAAASTGPGIIATLKGES